MQQDKLANLKKAPPVDAERARLKESLLKITHKRIAVVEQYAVRPF